MPKSKKTKKEEKIVSTKYERISTTSKTSRSVSRRRFVDTEEWVSKHINELVSSTGLDFLNLSNEEYIAIFTRIVDAVRGDSSTLDMDTIVRRIKRNIDKVYSLIAVAILELREQLSESQIEFIVNNINEAVLLYAPRLYNEALKLARTDLIERLKDSWRHAWTLKRYPILPLQCPRCGFNSLMPDLSCLVCGATVSEGELKKALNFRNMLIEFAHKEPLEDVKKAINYGYVYLSSIGIKPPGENKDLLDVEVFLTNEERSVLADIIKQRESEK